MIEVKIAKNVMLNDEFKNCVFYKVGCDCGNNDCTLDIELEYQEYAQ